MDVVEEVADCSIRRGVTRIQPGNKILWNDVVVAAFGRTEDCVEHTALKLDTADHERVDLERRECRRERGTLPDVETRLVDDD